MYEVTTNYQYQGQPSAFNRYGCRGSASRSAPAYPSRQTTIAAGVEIPALLQLVQAGKQQLLLG